MPKSNAKYILIGIFLLTLFVRLYLVFQHPYYSDDTAYFHVRQVDVIRETGLPLYQDDLSYGGRTYVFMPLFHYILAFFSSIMPTLVVGKLIPNICASLLVFIIFYITKNMTKNEDIALITAFLSGFIPVYFVQTINTLSIHSITVPLTFLLFYFIMNIDNKTIKLYIFLFIFFIATHPSIFLFIFSFIMYFVIVKTEKLKVRKGELELLFFSLIVVIWFYLLVFKKAFLSHGYSLIFQNIPNILLTEYFKQVSITEALYLIGFIPFIAGVWMIYHTVFSDKNRESFLLISFVIVITVSLWFKLIELQLGLMYLGVALAVLFGKACSLFVEYLNKTKAVRYKHLMYIVIIAVLISTSVIPSIRLAMDNINHATSKNIISGLSFAKEFSENSESRIISDIQSGHTITYFSSKKNLIDNNFLLIRDINEITTDLNAIFTTQSTTIGTGLLNKYNAEFVLLTENAKNTYKIQELPMYTSTCFERITFGEVILYRNLCRVVKS